MNCNMSYCLYRMQHFNIYISTFLDVLYSFYSNIQYIYFYYHCIETEMSTIFLFVFHNYNNQAIYMYSAATVCAR